MASAPLLEIRDLGVAFETRGGRVQAVDGLSFTIGRGEIVAIVGESGSGKSVTALSILRLVEREGGRIVSGAIRFSRGPDDVLDLVGTDEATLRRVRGNEIAMIFQEPMTSLNPVLTIGVQLAEVLVLHQGKSRDEALTIADDRRGSAQAGAHSRSRPTPATISARAFGRHAPARDDRYGARLPARLADRR